MVWLKKMKLIRLQWITFNLLLVVSVTQCDFNDSTTDQQMYDEIFMKINVRVWHWCIQHPFNCINPSEAKIVRPFCEEYGFDYEDFHKKENELNSYSNRLMQFRKNFKSLTGILSTESGSNINWEDFFERNQDLLSF